MKRFFIIFLTYILGCTSTIYADIYTGKCGENLSWTIDTKDSTLTIEGTGALWDVPWNLQVTNSWNGAKQYIKHVIIPEGVTHIGGGNFAHCPCLTEIHLPSTIRSIGEEAFAETTTLKSINLPEGLDSIAYSAFYLCKGLTSITLPTTLRVIEERAFAACTGLSTLAIPAGVQTIAGGAFLACNLTYNVADDNPYFCLRDGIVYSKDLQIAVVCPVAKQGQYSLPDEVKTILAYAFYESALDAIKLPDGIDSIGKYAFARCSSLERMDIPNSVRVIDEGALCSNAQLQSVHLSENLTNIPYGLLAYCPKLETVNIPKGITYIGSSAFRNDSSLVSIEMPGTMQLIGHSCFADCHGLKYIVFHEITNKILYNCLSRCSNLEYVVCDALVPPTLNYIRDFDFETVTLYVPEQSIEAYREADTWKLFTHILPLSERPMSIGDVPFNSCLEQNGSKILHNGHIYIIRGNNIYTLQGQEVK